MMLHIYTSLAWLSSAAVTKAMGHTMPIPCQPAQITRDYAKTCKAATVLVARRDSPPRTFAPPTIAMTTTTDADAARLTVGERMRRKAEPAIAVTTAAAATTASAVSGSDALAARALGRGTDGWWRPC